MTESGVDAQASWLQRLHLKEVAWVKAFASHERRRLLRPLMLAATRGADGWALPVIVPVALLVGGRAAGVGAVATGTVSAVLLALVVHGVKSLVRRARPTDVELLRPIGAPDVHAFPSGHTAHAFNLVAILWLLEPAAGLALLPFGVLVGLSRIFFGLHFPSDVVAGAVLGLAVGWATSWAMHAAGWVSWAPFA